MSGSGTEFENYLDYLKSLRTIGPYFLERGQAVNFWAEHIGSRRKSDELSVMRPFNSKDCDIWVSGQAWEKLRQLPEIRLGSSPADGQLGIVDLPGNNSLRIDFLSTVYGIPADFYSKLLNRVLDDGVINVIDPVTSS